jgi:hypothetical protein
MGFGRRPRRWWAGRGRAVCAAALLVAGVDGAAVSVVLSATPRETICASDPVASRLEELALTLGEGPGVDAVAGTPCLVADLRAAEVVARWPVFASAAANIGGRAVYALGLRGGGTRLEAMGLYRGQPGGLGPEQLADALVLADTAGVLVLDWRPGQVGPQHPEVHQAAGLITVQLGVSVEVALVRLRTYAYVHDRRLCDVAGDVVAHRLRFGPAGDEDGR